MKINSNFEINLTPRIQALDLAVSNKKINKNKIKKKLKKVEIFNHKFLKTSHNKKRFKKPKIAPGAPYNSTEFIYHNQSISKQSNESLPFNSYPSPKDLDPSGTLVSPFQIEQTLSLKRFFSETMSNTCFFSELQTEKEKSSVKSQYNPPINID